MRFPINLPPVTAVPEELRDVQPVSPPTIVRRIAERTRPHVFRLGFDRDRRSWHQSREQSEEAQPDVDDRRAMCRRTYNKPVMLDTRSGNGRRQQTRRETEYTRHILIKA